MSFPASINISDALSTVPTSFKTLEPVVLFPIETTEHTRKKTLVNDFQGNVAKILGMYLLNICRHQNLLLK